MQIKVTQEFVLGGRLYAPYRTPLPNGGGIAPQYDEIADDDLALWCCAQGWAVPVKAAPAETTEATETETPTRRRGRANPEEGTE